MKRIIAIIIVSISLTVYLSGCKTDNSTSEQANYIVENMNLFPANQYRSHNIGHVLVTSDYYIVPRISEWFRFNDDLVGESGNPYMHMGLEYGDVAIIDEIAGPNGELLKKNEDIFLGVDFYESLAFQLFFFDIETGRKLNSVNMPLFSHDTIFVDILATQIDESGDIRLLTRQISENKDISVHYYHFASNNLYKDYFEQIIDDSLLGGKDISVRNVWFDKDQNIILLIYVPQTNSFELVVLDNSASQIYARFETDVRTVLTMDNNGCMWRTQTVYTLEESYSLLDALDSSTWSWTDRTRISIPFINGINKANVGSTYKWFIRDDIGMYGVKENGDVTRYLTWVDVGVEVTQFSQVLFTPDEDILIINQFVHPDIKEAITISTDILRRTDVVDEREILTVGGVSVNDRPLIELVRQFNRMSTTHRAVIVDYAETGEWVGSAMRLRTDLITGQGPDIIIFNQWGDENDITNALMRGGYLADLNVFLDNDSFLSREDFFENILDVWTNEAGELSLITGAVIPTLFWGPEMMLEGFTDFTHEGYLEFLQSSKDQGVPFPAGLSFITVEVLRTMLFADDTFVCFKTGEVNFDNNLFIDILNYAKSTLNQHDRLMEALQTGEAYNPVTLFSRNEQLMTRMPGIMTVKDFRIYDAVVDGLTPIGEPNSTSKLAIPIAPIWRIGIRANSQNQEAAWEFIRLHLQCVNSDSWIFGFPILRSLFENEVNKEILEGAFSAGGFMGMDKNIEIPAFSEERAAVLRYIMESITHEANPEPLIFRIILEEASTFFDGAQTVQDAARIIQSRVSIYISEQS